MHSFAFYHILKSTQTTYGCMDVCMSELKCSTSPLTVLQGDPELKVTDVGGVSGKGLDLAGNARTKVWTYEYWKLTIKMQNSVAASSH
jgi:hypothetical protein